MATIFSRFKLWFSKKISGPEGFEPANEHSFDAAQEKEEAYDSVPRGTLLVPMDKIVGSVGKYNDFDNQFKKEKPVKSERLENLIQVMISGKSLPPISLYQIKEEFFILDGHHRYQAARELNYTHIRAKIVELLPSKNNLENLLYLEKTHFRDEADLPESLNLTEPDQTRHLRWQIEEHQKYLQQSTDKPQSFQEAAKDWYQTIYQPLKKLISNSSLIKNFPNRTEDDLYLYISVHQWEKGKDRKYGIEIDRFIPTDMEKFRTEIARGQKEYPEMKREISFFILFVIEGKYERQIFDKLFQLDEIREVHSVHGSIDLIAKATLHRDLLSSDTEIISQFTYTIRQWKGVVSTQTLIPGLSRCKENDRCLL